MDKGFFGLALVVVGLVGVWALVTGKLKPLIAAGASTALADSLNKAATNGFTGPASGSESFGSYGVGVTSSNASFGTYGTTSTNIAPASLQTGDRTMSYNLGGPGLAYGVAIGDAGAKIEPLGSMSVG